ncbi:alginate O-acetyltransferase complex protein AlgF [Yoonia maritima]|uniref:Alginate biosynthesis protein AlgF n=1 Tax=Yoonia maritima TaxID=1435347 RepID=A0A2T0VZI9_9RHOB|nr:alginate O-acetyltransferase AlgF [Yoonia maritima]PRY77778.1 alginate O-acetyltransferase complex protein AlgF [Yoonia maritima]
MKLPFTVALAAILTQVSPALADDGLYQDVADPNSSFVRVVAPGQTVASINGESVSDIASGVSDYVNVMPGEIDVVVPNGTGVVEVGPSAYYTVLFTEDGQTEIVTDDITNSPSKADISIYNLTDTPSIDVFVPQANAVAVEGIEAMQGQSVAIKAPLTLDFELRSGDEVLATVSEVELIRNAGVSIVLLQTDDGYSAFATDNSYLK